MAEQASPQVFDLVVIGSGPGGYIGAIRAAQLGLQVACVEQEPALGGTCLRIGCIPSKALLEATHKYHEAKHSLGALGINLPADAVTVDLPKMMQRKDQVVKTLTQGIAGLFKKNKVTRFVGTASFDGREPQGAWRLRVSRPAEGQATAPASDTILAKRVLIATGSVEAKLPGVELDRDRIGTSTEALKYPEVPEHLVVIGAGAIGLEMGSVWSRLGAKVTVLEYAPRILAGMDAELGQAAQRILSKQGLQFKLESKVTKVTLSADKKSCHVELQGQDPIDCDRVLMAVGRVANTAGLCLEKVGLKVDERGRVPIDSHFATAAENIYAIGDVVVGPMLAHKAEEEAVACVEHMVKGYGHVDYNAIAYVVYTTPEVASVGQPEETLKAQNIPYKKGSFPFMANARARAMGDTDGFCKVLAHRDTDRILGVHIVGPHAGELIAEAATAMSFGASSEDLARTCHAHPTLSEVIKEACLAVDGRTLNL
jgi:dihydrolipoamide dehydrogenase